jgi:O-antigen ligase
VVNTYERLQKTLLAAIAGAALASLYVIREFQASGGTNLRPGYIAGDANYFATCTLLVIPMAVYFVKMKGALWQRWFCAAALVLMLVAFTLASSRGGLVGLCVTVLYMGVRSAQSRRTAIGIVLLLVPLLVFSPASPLQRMLHPNYGDYVGAQIRREFWEVGFDMIRDHPLTGIGLGNFTAYSLSKEVAGFHGIACNTFLEVAAELGIPGLLAYCAVLVGALISAGKLRKHGRRNRDAFLQCAGQAMEAGLLGFAAAAFFVSAEYQKPFWIMVALTACIPSLLQDGHRARPSRRETADLATTQNPSAAEACCDAQQLSDSIFVSEFEAGSSGDYEVGAAVDAPPSRPEWLRVQENLSETATGRN